jgi:hypothetical protein
MWREKWNKNLGQATHGWGNIVKIWPPVYTVFTPGVLHVALHLASLQVLTYIACCYTHSLEATATKLSKIKNNIPVSEPLIFNPSFSTANLRHIPFLPNQFDVS